MTGMLLLDSEPCEDRVQDYLGHAVSSVLSRLCEEQSKYLNCLDKEAPGISTRLYPGAQAGTILSLAHRQDMK